MRQDANCRALPRQFVEVRRPGNGQGRRCKSSSMERRSQEWVGDGDIFNTGLLEGLTVLNLGFPFGDEPPLSGTTTTTITTIAT